MQFDCQPHTSNKAISSAYKEWLSSTESLTLRPLYQRNLAWDDDQKSLFIDTLMTRCPCQVFLLYMNDEDDDHECIDGQNRLTTIKDYIEQTPEDDPFAWKQMSVVENVLVEEYIYYPPSTQGAKGKWQEYFGIMDKKRKPKGVKRVYRSMDDKEKRRFDSYQLSVSEIKTRLSFEQRKAIFMRWQNGSPISQCDSYKNEDYPFCKFIIEESLEKRFVPLMSDLLKSGQQNWIWDLRRLLLPFLSGGNSMDALQSTIKSRTEIQKETIASFNKDAWKQAAMRLEKYLKKMSGLAKEKNKVQISFLIALAVVYLELTQELRGILEQEEVLIAFKKAHLDGDEPLKNTLNNGPNQTEILERFPRFRQELYQLLNEKRSPVVEKTKVTRPTIPAAVKTNVWNAYIGKEKGVGDCTCCGTQISSREFHAGHLVPHTQGGQATVENLRPVCGPCNQSMYTTNMLTYMKKHYPDRVKGFVYVAPPQT